MSIFLKISSGKTIAYDIMEKTVSIFQEVTMKKEDWMADQISLSEYIDPFTGEKVKGNK